MIQRNVANYTQIQIITENIQHGLSVCLSAQLYHRFSFILFSDIVRYLPPTHTHTHNRSCPFRWCDITCATNGGPTIIPCDYLVTTGYIDRMCGNYLIEIYFYSIWMAARWLHVLRKLFSMSPCWAAYIEQIDAANSPINSIFSIRRTANPLPLSVQKHKYIYRFNKIVMYVNIGLRFYRHLQSSKNITPKCVWILKRVVASRSSMSSKVKSELRANERYKKWSKRFAEWFRAHFGTQQRPASSK